MSQSDQVLAAAAKGNSPITASEIVVRAWQADRAQFGLQSFEQQYPDANKVLALLMGDKGLVSRGLLERVGPKVYRVTALGRRQLNGEPEPAPERKETVALSTGQERFAYYCLNSIARDLWQQGLKHDIQWSHATAFWNFDQSGGAARRLEIFVEQLRAIGRRLAEGPTTLPSGRVVTALDIADLIALHNWLKNRFASKLEREEQLA